MSNNLIACKDCRHSSTHISGGVCVRPKEVKYYDYYKGKEIIRISKNHILVEYERQDVSRCGPNARFFDPKLSLKEKWELFKGNFKWKS